MVRVHQHRSRQLLNELLSHLTSEYAGDLWEASTWHLLTRVATHLGWPALNRLDVGRSVSDRVVTAALAILARQVRMSNALTSPRVVRDYLRLALANKEHEVFVAVLLDAQNRVLSCEEMFRGTLTQTSVYPREIVKSALAANAAAIIFAHNHPSGCSDPSQADEVLTSDLKKALALVDVKVLDHFIIAGGDFMSFAERGLL